MEIAAPSCCGKSSSVRRKIAEAGTLPIFKDWLFLFAGKARFSSVAKGLDALFKVGGLAGRVLSPAFQCSAVPRLSV